MKRRGFLQTIAALVPLAFLPKAEDAQVLDSADVKWPDVKSIVPEFGICNGQVLNVRMNGTGESPSPTARSTSARS